MEIVPIRRLTWSRESGALVCNVRCGYQVRAKNGETISTGTTRDEALERAREYMMLARGT